VNGPELAIVVGGLSVFRAPVAPGETVDLVLLNDPPSPWVNDFTHKREDFELNYLPFALGGYDKRVPGITKDRTVAAFGLSPFLEMFTNFPYICPPTTKP
jgi:hypothetical protein